MVCLAACGGAGEEPGWLAEPAEPTGSSRGVLPAPLECPPDGVRTPCRLGGSVEEAGPDGGRGRLPNDAVYPLAAHLTSQRSWVLSAGFMNSYSHNWGPLAYVSRVPFGPPGPTLVATEQDLRPFHGVFDGTGFALLTGPSSLFRISLGGDVGGEVPVPDCVGLLWTGAELGCLQGSARDEIEGAHMLTAEGEPTGRRVVWSGVGGLASPAERVAATRGAFGLITVVHAPDMPRGVAPGVIIVDHDGAVLGRTVLPDWAQPVVLAAGSDSFVVLYALWLESLSYRLSRPDRWAVYVLFLGADGRARSAPILVAEVLLSPLSPLAASVAVGRDDALVVHADTEVAIVEGPRGSHAQFDRSLKMRSVTPAGDLGPVLEVPVDANSTRLVRDECRVGLAWGSREYGDIVGVWRGTCE